MLLWNSRFYISLFGGISACLLAVQGARATDAELQSALQRSGCKIPSIKQLMQRGDVTVFEANCSQTSHRVITVTCTKRICQVDEPVRQEDSSRR